MLRLVMAVTIEDTPLPGVKLCTPDAYQDPRGYFMETFHQERYAEGGIEGPFVQDNFSHSSLGTLRGLHYQIRHPQGKLIYVLQGEIYDAVVDIRRGSPTYGEWYGCILSSENRKQVFAPVGFAHGFCVMSETADVAYKCTDVYCPEGERGLLWSDPDIAIDWPLDEPLLSERDQKHPLLRDINDEDLPAY